MIGAVQINNETLEANVMPSAVFSAMKYREPPHNPDKNNKNTMIQKIFTFKHNCVRIRFLFAAKLFKEDCFPIRQA